MDGAGGRPYEEDRSAAGGAGCLRTSAARALTQTGPHLVSNQLLWVLWKSAITGRVPVGLPLEADLGHYSGNREILKERRSVFDVSRGCATGTAKPGIRKFPEMAGSVKQAAMSAMRFGSDPPLASPVADGTATHGIAAALPLRFLQFPIFPSQVGGAVRPRRASFTISTKRQEAAAIAVAL